MPGRQEVSVDAALTTIGEFGLGQRLQLCVAGLAWVAAALQTLLVVFGNLMPLHNVTCVRGNEACLAELAKPRPDVCRLEPGTWEWTHKRVAGRGVASSALVGRRSPAARQRGRQCQAAPAPAPGAEILLACAKQLQLCCAPPAPAG